uniref:Spexin hormone n=1 Tax=Oncorhynchus mykiss TaxID=8022 RepID=A0A8K9Y1Y5_ONCMY
MITFLTITVYALALLLLATLVSHSWSAPKGSFQRRNWSPQAMLYLKGTQGRRFISEDRKEGDVYDTLHLDVYHHLLLLTCHYSRLSVNQAATVLLNFLRQAKEDKEHLEQLYFQDLPAWKREYF